MEKIITIDGRQVKMKSTGAYLLKYKSQFGRDALRDVFKLYGVFDAETKEVKNLEALDLEVFYNLIWTLAKTADPSIGPPEQWLDGFSEFPLMDIIPEVMELITSCIKSTAKSKKK
jgi:hypothetical protein